MTTVSNLSHKYPITIYYQTNKKDLVKFIQPFHPLSVFVSLSLSKMPGDYVKQIINYRRPFWLTAFWLLKLPEFFQNIKKKVRKLGADSNENTITHFSKHTNSSIVLITFHQHWWFN